MASLILYVTEHCSLCDTAMELLASLPEAAGVSLAVVDIATPGSVCAEDFEALGPRLPVLAVLDAPTVNLGAAASLAQQLDWPFTGHQVAQLLQR